MAPNEAHFGHHPAIHLEPNIIELPDEKVLLAIAVNVGPTRRRVARAFHTDGHPARFQTHRTFEFRGAAQGGAAEGQ